MGHNKRNVDTSSQKINYREASKRNLNGSTSVLAIKERIEDGNL